MNKNKIIVIACLMGVALIGLVILQVNWIRHDLELRQEKFTQEATDAVNNAIEKLETRESVHFIARSMEGVLDDSITGYFKSMQLPVVPEVPVIPEAPLINDFTFEMDTIENASSFTFVTDGDTLPGENEVRIISRSKGSDGEVTVSLQSPGGKTSVDFNKYKTELETVQKQLSKERENFEKAREMAVRSTKIKKESEKVKRRVKSLSNVIEKMAVEYERRDFYLLDRLAPEVVDSLVGSELKNNGISLPYSIELTSGSNDSVLWKRVDPELSSSGNKSVKVKLFPGDIINRNDSVKVTFSDTIRHFISSMWMMLLSSALFTGIVIFAFSYTILVIFRQKKLSEIKNDFINNMTHEFKTPIATIRLASEAIRNPEVIRDVEKVKYYSGIIKDENERMNGHVENILQMAQFDKQAFAPNLEPIDMHEVIHDSILMMQLHAEEKGGKIVFNPEATHFQVMADRRFIPLVVLNLLDNAIKYTEQTAHIEVGTRNKDGELIISVTDNGIGMSKDKQKKIFDKFYRVTTGNLHNVKGFGLGLSYVKAIVTAHGGEVSVESEPGKGSCFEVKLKVTS